MKKQVILLVLGFIFSFRVFAQANRFSNSELSSICKAWGLIKYYSPAVSQGRLNWDSVVVAAFSNPVKEKADIIIKRWLTQINTISFEKKEPYKYNCDSITARNFSMAWIASDPNISKANKQALTSLVKDPKNVGTFYSNAKPNNIRFDAANEKTYAATSTELKMVDLFRIWNAIEYFYPYKYLLDHKWGNVLDKYIPLFKNISSEKEYKTAITLLAAEINDTHAHLEDTYDYDVLGKLSSPFMIQLAENKAVVTKIKDEKAAAGIAVGDVITKINGEPINVIINRNKKYIPASNASVQRREAYRYLFSGNDSTFAAEGIKESGAPFKATVRRMLRVFKSEWDADGKPDCHLHYLGKDYEYLQWNAKESRLYPLSVIGDKAYIEFSNIQPEEIDSVMKICMDKKGIVFDLRSYNNDGRLMKVFNYLFKAPQFFGIKTHADFNAPGKFCFEDNIIDKTIKTIGKNNPEAYKGLVVVLMNEYTQSAEEMWAMIFRKIPGAVFIGSQTAGADGNMTGIKLTTGNFLHFSGLGIYYPSGEETQRIGIKPDITVLPTVESIRKREDLLLLKAFEEIDKRK
jgi:hypothetical protein